MVEEEGGGASLTLLREFLRAFVDFNVELDALIVARNQSPRILVVSVFFEVEKNTFESDPYRRKILDN